MKTKLRFAMLLGALGLVGACLDQAYGANAYWAEEMDALPNVNHLGRWGAFPKSAGDWHTAAVQTADGWSIPDGQGAGSASAVLDGDYRTTATGGLGGFALGPGVAVLNGPADDTPSPAAGKASFSFETRFRITGALPTNAFPIQFELDNVGNVPFWFSYGMNTGGETIFGNINAGLNGGGFIGQNSANPPQTPVPLDNAWHTVRVTQDYTGDQMDGIPSSGTMNIYWDGSLMNSFDLSGLAPGQVPSQGALVGYNRSFKIAKDGSTGVEWDYARFAMGVVPIGESINPVPEPTAGLLALVVCGLGVAARRRS